MRTILPASLIAAALSLGIPTVLSAQDAVLPLLVIVDSEGKSIGPVIGVEADEDIVAIRFVDPQVGAPVLLQLFGKDWIRSDVGDTYFSDDACQGNAFHFAFQTFGLNELTGYFYSVARTPDGGPQTLFRSDSNVPGAVTPIQSHFDSDFDTCNDAGGSLNLRPATLVMDLDNAHPPPYAILPLQ